MCPQSSFPNWYLGFCAVLGANPEATFHELVADWLNLSHMTLPLLQRRTGTYVGGIHLGGDADQEGGATAVL